MPCRFLCIVQPLGDCYMNEVMKKNRDGYLQARISVKSNAKHSLAIVCSGGAGSSLRVDK
jgi:hypothetical protein